MNKHKKLLIISHNCLSKTGSNGRTLENLLSGWPKEKLAQFYIHAEIPDFEVCENYFCITDSSISRSIMKRKPAGYVVDKISTFPSIQNKQVSKRKTKNSFLYLIREMAWRSGLWNSKDFDSWVETFRPELILVQAGDASFLFYIALEISKKFDAQIVIYNTEGYYFKEYSYLTENSVTRLLYPILNSIFKKAYNKLVHKASTEVYNCDLLRNDYEAIFHTNSRVIMNASEFTEEEVFKDKKRKIVYAGNLGINRHKSLIEFSEALHKVEPDLVVDVYGKAPDEDIESELEHCSGIRMNGYVSYEELKHILRESKYLLHIESFDDFYKEDLKYAFSTKIADSLAVGACLFVYAPENMAVAQYLKGKKAAVLITAPQSLEEEIKDVMQNESLCQTYADNGRKLAEKNHNFRKNREDFQNILST